MEYVHWRTSLTAAAELQPCPCQAPRWPQILSPSPQSTHHPQQQRGQTTLGWDTQEAPTVTVRAPLPPTPLAETLLRWDPTVRTQAPQAGDPGTACSGASHQEVPEGGFKVPGGCVTCVRGVKA